MDQRQAQTDSNGCEVFEKLGPYPERSLAAMVAYGLNDTEIARYYSISPSSVRRLRLVFGALQES